LPPALTAPLPAVRPLLRPPLPRLFPDQATLARLDGGAERSEEAMLTGLPPLQIQALSLIWDPRRPRFAATGEKA
jgi:hypothetical protein